MPPLIKSRSNTTYILIFLLVWAFAWPVCANIKTDVVGSAGYTSNLLGDSTLTGDSYYTVDANINIYPVAPLEINIDNKYTYYSKLFKLSNFFGGVGFKYLPLSRDSRLNFLVNGRFTTQHYRDSMFFSNVNLINYSNNNDIYNYGFSGTYRLTSTIHARAGVSYDWVNYTDYSGADRKTWKYFAGLNFSVLGNSSVDIEAGFAAMDYRRFDDTVTALFLMPNFPAQKAYVDSLMQNDRLHSFYVSPRFSRQLGSKFGFNITYNYRKFKDFSNKRVYGLNSGFLSPWASVYDGQSITFSLKSYFIPGFTANAGAGYWDKSFFKTLEQWYGRIADPTPTRGSHIKNRHDYQSRFYAGLTRPFTLGGGTNIEPTITYEYENNNSSYSFYDYSKTTVTLILNIKM